MVNSYLQMLPIKLMIKMLREFIAKLSVIWTEDARNNAKLVLSQRLKKLKKRGPVLPLSSKISKGIFKR